MSKIEENVMPPKTDVPFDATPAALHFRLKSLEDKVDELPDQLVEKLQGKFRLASDCIAQQDKCKMADIPWGKIIASFLIAITTLATAYAGLVKEAAPVKETTMAAPK